MSWRFLLPFRDSGSRYTKNKGNYGLYNAFFLFSTTIVKTHDVVGMKLERQEKTQNIVFAVYKKKGECYNKIRSFYLKGKKGVLEK